MLKELFEAHIYSTFSKVEDKVLMLDERIEQGDFTLLDTKACQGCRLICSDNSEKREQLKVHSDQTVNVVSIEQVFSYVRENIGEICDYMLDGTKSVILVEMTCSTADYVTGKRQKARGQLYNTLLLLFKNPIVRSHIEGKQVRYVIFSWKDTSSDNKEMDSVEESMKGMIQMTDEVYSPDNESKFDFGFKLREIRYPDVLICD